MRAIALFFITVVFATAASAVDPRKLDEHMAEHFAFAVQLQSAVVDADLEAARTAAGWLADHSVSGHLPEDTLADLAVMRAAARDVVEAPDMDHAAQATARMAVACGQCHLRMGVNPGFASDLEPATGDSAAERMSRHQWAADRLWEGLIAPDERAWRSGTEVLLDAPFTAGDLGRAPDPEIDRMGEQIRQLARAADNDHRSDQRVWVYGGFLARCAACHSIYRGK